MRAFGGVCAAILLASYACADEPKALEADKAALSTLQSYVGGWRGVGMPRRGSSQGAWTEEAEWSWRFAEGRAELAATLDNDKYFRTLAIARGSEPGEFVVSGSAEKVAATKYRGQVADGELVATAIDAVPEDRPARITVRLVAGGDRMLVLYEKKQGESFARLAEVGSTRKGSNFAKSALAGPECVVTGGLGTIAVMHDGKTYYVCCGGCRDLFEDDPAAALAEYRQRKEAEKNEKK